MVSLHGILLVYLKIISIYLFKYSTPPAFLLGLDADPDATRT
jgi:hypothetical protein